MVGIFVGGCEVGLFEGRLVGLLVVGLFVGTDATIEKFNASMTAMQVLMDRTIFITELFRIGLGL